MKKYFDYDYAAEMTHGENQYLNEYDIVNEKRVDARYIPSPSAPGNPFIEALPRYLTTIDVACYYNHELSFPVSEKLKVMDEYEKLESIQLLSDVRFPLSYHADVEREFHRALVESYRNREPMNDSSIDIPYTASNTEQVAHEKLVAVNQSASVTGFSLLGVSGCGKSSSITMLTNNYPQVITHYPKGDAPIRQIVYLIVVCPQGSNFNVLYTEIGKQIDRALGNIIPVYEEQISKMKSLGKKAAEVARLIELFHIGIIIFDEIQQINMATTHENSIESLLTLNNTTNVAIAVVGTEDTFNKMFKVKRVVRRLGSLIPASKYCDNYKTFTRIVNNLFRYSWVNEPVAPTEEMMQYIYYLTEGVIDQIIKLYQYIQCDLVHEESRAKDDPNYKISCLDIEFIKKTAKRHNLGNPQTYGVGNSGSSKVFTSMIERMNSHEQNYIQNRTMEELDDIMKKQDFYTMSIFKNRVITKILEKTNGKFSYEKIEKVFNNVITTGNDIQESEAITMILQKLEKRDPDSVEKELAKARKPAHDDIRSYLMSNHDPEAGIIAPATDL